jgi:hypothetical protein
MEEFFSLQKEQLGIIPSTPIKLTHDDNWVGIKLTHASEAVQWYGQATAMVNGG